MAYLSRGSAWDTKGVMFPCQFLLDSFSSVRSEDRKGRMMKWKWGRLASAPASQKAQNSPGTSRRAKYVAGGPKRERNHSCETN